MEEKIGKEPVWIESVSTPTANYILRGGKITEKDFYCYQHFQRILKARTLSAFTLTKRDVRAGRSWNRAVGSTAW